jgi:hypothetical protein
MTARKNWSRVVVRWGDYELLTRHLRPGDGFVVAERDGDFAIDRRQLGAERVELVRMNDSCAELVVPESFEASVHRGGGVSDARRSPARLVQLARGESVRLEQGLLVIEVHVEHAERSPPWRRRRFGEWRLLVALGAAAVTCAMPLVAGALTFDEPGPGIDPAQLRLMRYYLGSDADADPSGSDRAVATSRDAAPDTANEAALEGLPRDSVGDGLAEEFLPCLDDADLAGGRRNWLDVLAGRSDAASIYCR